ncbi:hypothetical protein WA016_05531 [Myxococcus stipitatus]
MAGGTHGWRLLTSATCACPSFSRCVKPRDMTGERRDNGPCAPLSFLRDVGAGFQIECSQHLTACMREQRSLPPEADRLARRARVLEAVAGGAETPCCSTHVKRVEPESPPRTYHPGATFRSTLGFIATGVTAPHTSPPPGTSVQTRTSMSSISYGALGTTSPPATSPVWPSPEPYVVVQERDGGGRLQGGITQPCLDLRARSFTSRWADTAGSFTATRFFDCNDNLTGTPPSACASHHEHDDFGSRVGLTPPTQGLPRVDSDTPRHERTARDDVVEKQAPRMGAHLDAGDAHVMDDTSRKEMAQAALRKRFVHSGNGRLEAETVGFFSCLRETTRKSRPTLPSALNTSTRGTSRPRRARPEAPRLAPEKRTGPHRARGNHAESTGSTRED